MGCSSLHLLLQQSHQLLQISLLLLLLLMILVTVVPTQSPHCVRGRWHPESRRDPEPYLPSRIPSTSESESGRGVDGRLSPAKPIVTGRP